MTTLILDADFEAQALAQRRALGLDRYDEVWDGVYVMAPLANNEHQRVATKLSAVLERLGEELNAEVLWGGNVSDRRDDWTTNYRCPDNAVFMADSPAENLSTHWLGGPDFAVEIISPKDKTWDKLDFYASVNTRELLIIDREPWKLSLLRLAGDKLVLAGESIPAENIAIASAVLPIALQLVSRENEKPVIEVRHHDGRRWIVDPVARGR
jgi:Uma2 family endonuclease